MPQGIYSDKFCGIKYEKSFEPRPHQKAVLKYFLESKYKGLLLYHELGSGKTCTSIMVADKMIKKGLIKRVFVVSPGSLRSGWIGEYCQVCGKDDDYLEKYFTFITYNYNVGKNLPNLDNSLVIIDEVHNLINGTKNMSKNATLIYDSLQKANCRILALSGTPVYNDVFEFALLGNLLKPGGEFPEIRLMSNNNYTDIDKKAFMKFFDEQADGTLIPKNPTSFKRRVEGIVSFFPGNKKYVPTLLIQEPIKVQMTTDQEMNYWVMVEQERVMEYPPRLSMKKENPEKYELLKDLYIMAKKKIISRKASNFFYPEQIGKTPDLSSSRGGWVKKKYFMDGNMYKIFSTKFAVLLLNIVMHNRQKHVVYTFFLNKSGVVLLKTLLNMCGVTARIFSGELDDTKRKILLKKFNSPDNRYGDKIRVLLVTEAGAEGISILEARHIHILESSTRVNKTKQAIGRVARYKSHIKLPESERNVKVWRYWSTASPAPLSLPIEVNMPDGSKKMETKVIVDKECIDEYLYKKGVITIRKIDSFLDLLKNSSVTIFEE